MSSFICAKCGTPVLDSHEDYITACKHFPYDVKRKEVKPMPKGCGTPKGGKKGGKKGK